MKLDAADLLELADCAIAGARDAGRMIARSHPAEMQGNVEYKAGGETLASQVVTEVDRRSEEIILGHLTPTLERFGLGLLTEERDDDGGRLVADYFWCVDPLDGTLPFVEGQSGYAVSVALVGRDGTPVVGVVHDPVGATMLHAVSGIGAFRDGDPWTARPQRLGEQLSVFADRSFVTGDDYGAIVDSLDRIAVELGLSGAELHIGRGAVMNACGVLDNPPGCYVKFPTPRGGGSLWDFAATACLFSEIGAVATDIHGAPLDLNRPDSLFMNHRGVLFATDEQLAGRLRALHPGPGRG